MAVLNNKPIEMRSEAVSSVRYDLEPVLLVSGLSLSIVTERGDYQAVEDVSFKVHRGEIVALVGESGAGKSITSMSILRLLPMPPVQFTAGEVFLNGRDLRRMTRKEMREVRGNQASVIFQEPMTALNPALRVGRQIAEPLVRHRGMGWREAERKAVELLARVQVPDPEHRVKDYPHQFSGGMRQRVMIAMALACEPGMIIADEPTTALDVTVQAQILSLLADLTRSSNGGLLLITHDLGVVARYADYLNIMYAGRIVEHGPTDAVFANPAHPYTRGLLASAPRLSGEVVDRLPAIPGQPPSLIGGVRGCAFAERCSSAMPRCRVENPELLAIEGAHEVACWVGRT